MNRQDETPRTLSADELRAALGASAASPRTDYLADIVADAARTRQRPGWTLPAAWLPWSTVHPTDRATRPLVLVIAVALLAALLLVPAILVGSRSGPPADGLGIFRPVAGRIVFGDARGIWAVDPAAPADASDLRLVSDEIGMPLEWSRDGTRLLLVLGDTAAQERLAILDADGTQRLLTAVPMRIEGATISPDGSRVVFAASMPEAPLRLYAVDAQGGTPRVLADFDGCCRAPAFSPDGLRIAFFAGGGDHANSVWVVNADGSSPTVVVPNDDDSMPGHVGGLAWSPDGTRLAWALGGVMYTGTPTGSRLTRLAGDTDPASQNWLSAPAWSPDGSKLAWTGGCTVGWAAVDRSGCHLFIGDPFAQDATEFLAAAGAGPWHPGQP